MSKDQRRRRRLEVARQRAEDDAVRFVLADPRGRLFFHQWLEKTGLFGRTFTHPGTSSNQVLHAEGRRSVGYDLMQQAVRVDAANYHLMFREEMERLEAERLQRENEARDAERVQEDDPDDD